MPVDEGTVATSAIPGRSEPSRFPDTATAESVPHPGSRPSKGLRGIAPDALALTLIFLLGGLFAVRVVDWGVPPFEDAAMLMHMRTTLPKGMGSCGTSAKRPVTHFRTVSTSKGVGTCIQRH
jgi:hypothetical protein